MAPRESPARSPTVRSSAANAIRPGSYGIETVTSARAASASRSAHSAPVRSSKPYAKTGAPDQASRSPRSRSTAMPAQAVPIPEPQRPSSSRYATTSCGRSPSERVRRRRAPTRARRSCAEACRRTPPSARRRAQPVELRARYRTPNRRALAGARMRPAAPLPSSAMCRNRSSNVPIVPASSAGRRRTRSRST